MGSLWLFTMPSIAVIAARGSIDKFATVSLRTLPSTRNVGPGNTEPTWISKAGCSARHGGAVHQV
ncbi:hypothetical protein B1987_08910 [Mycobacterium kansasii]|nr:hypothetical protein B1987_08910 [Mycobacterium kansasii]